MSARDDSIRQAAKLAAETAVGAYAALLGNDIAAFLDLLEESQQWAWLAETQFYDGYSAEHTELGILRGKYAQLLAFMDGKKPRPPRWDLDND